jgi:hypothetical protein
MFLDNIICPIDYEKELILAKNVSFPRFGLDQAGQEMGDRIPCKCG